MQIFGKRKQKYAGYFILCLIFSSFLIPMAAQERVVDEVKFKSLPDGYEITANFLFPIQYQSHVPDGPGKELYVLLKTAEIKNLTLQQFDSLRERINWGPDPTTSIPLQRMTFEGSDPEHPQMIFIFTEEVECAVHSSPDLRSLVVKVKTKHPPPETLAQKEEIPSQKAAEKERVELPLPEKVMTEDQVLAKLMEEARDALIKGEYDHSVELYVKILETAQGPAKQQAQELLGVALERKGQLAQAKDVYRKYLNDYPKSPDAQRVRQRLAGLTTAAEAPKERLKAAKRAGKEEKGKWRVQNYGSISQFFFRDQTIPEGGQTQVNRSDFSTDLDLNSRWRNDDLDIRARFTGGHQQNFLRGKDNRDRISALSIDMRSKKKGLYGKLGRQYLSTGGIFGRFDGAYGSAKLNPMVELNGVFGYPIESTQQIGVQTDRRFYGLSLDFGTFRQKWDFNTFFVNQQNSGMTDRQAVGAEVRYFDPQKAFFTLFDYDIFFKAVNIFLFNGHYTFPTKTTLNFIYDYRKSPFLTLNNAIIGQGVEKISDLLSRFSKDEIKQLAKDRTTNSKSVTFGITQDLKKDWQLAAEVSLSELEGTIGSGGVEGQEGTGWDATYSTQVIGSNVFKENDVFISGFSYSNTSLNNIYSLNLNASLPLTPKTRVMPRMRFDYQDAKDGGTTRTTLRPAVRFDYNFKQWMHLEVEGGLEFVNENAAGTKHKSTESFISVGYRINF